MSIIDRGFHRLKLSNIDVPQPPPKHLQVTILAAALNHRDLFIRQSLYPAISFTTPLLADGCGIVTGLPSSTTSSKYLNKRVILTPSQGWESSPDGPEGGKGITILGGTKTIELGTAQEVLVVHEDEVEVAPELLSDEQAAALPLTGLTAWRAFVTKSGNAEEGRNILVTGIGGGVALNVLQFAVGKGCNVYVTMGVRRKLRGRRRWVRREGSITRITIGIRSWSRCCRRIGDTSTRSLMALEGILSSAVSGS